MFRELSLKKRLTFCISILIDISVIIYAVFISDVWRTARAIAVIPVLAAMGCELYSVRRSLHAKGQKKAASSYIHKKIA